MMYDNGIVIMVTHILFSHYFLYFLGLFSDYSCLAAVRYFHISKCFFFFFLASFQPYLTGPVLLHNTPVTGLQDSLT